MLILIIFPWLYTKEQKQREQEDNFKSGTIVVYLEKCFSLFHDILVSFALNDASIFIRILFYFLGLPEESFITYTARDG